MTIYSCKPTGVLAIDVQHQKLIDAFDRLERFSQVEHSLAAAMDTLIFLRSYSKEHFAYEEQVLAERNYPELAAHIELHKIILAEIEQLWTELENGEEIGERVIRRMRSWVLDHINIADAAYANFLKKTETSKQPASVISQ